jgi:protein-disulfide isomerase
MTKKKKPHLEHPESEASFFSGIGVAVIVFCILGAAAILYAINRDTPINSAPTANTGTITNLPNTPDSPTADLERIHIDSLRNVQGEGALTLVEFTDMTCEFCQRYHSTVSEILSQRNGKIAYSLKHFPLDGIQAGARAALAAECADDQNAYFTFAEQVFEGSIEGDADLIEIADELSLNTDEFEECLAKNTHETRVEDDTLQALATGATGAPWSILVDQDGRILMRFKGAIGKKRLNEALQMAIDDQKENE